MCPPPKQATARFETGQVVAWPHAPLGWAQVIELRRRRVRLFYRRRTGREAMPIVNAWVLLDVQTKSNQPLPLHNPCGRGMLKATAKNFAAKE